MLQDILVTICSFFIIAFLCAKRKGQTAFLRIFTFPLRAVTRKKLSACVTESFFWQKCGYSAFLIRSSSAAFG